MSKYLLCWACLLALSPLYGQSDVAGSADHPLLTRYPGAYIAYYETVKYREYQLATGPVTGYRQIDEQETLAGQLTRITYYIDQEAEALSISEVYRDYLQAVQRAGISILAEGHNPQASARGAIGEGGWIGLALGANPFPQGAAANLLFAGTSSSGGTFALIGRVERPGGPTYLALYGERHSRDRVVCHLDVIEVKGAQLGQVVADAAYISQEIEARGSVSIYGITFDFDQSTLKPESAPALAEIAAYLQAHPGVNLYVVGHTDMQGTLAYNLQLSKARAQAVVEALVTQHGIDRGRLIPDGVAFLSPKASNHSEEGRAVNRRTELVRRWE